MYDRYAIRILHELLVVGAEGSEQFTLPEVAGRAGVGVETIAQIVAELEELGVLDSPDRRDRQPRVERS